MRTTILLFIAGLVSFAGAGLGGAAEAPHSPEELEESATHIVSGIVQKVTSKVVPNPNGSGNTDRVYEITVRVAVVTKGDGIEKDKVIVVQAWRPDKRPKPFDGPQGHSNIPEKGRQVRLYLKKVDSVYKVIHPNGIHPLEVKPDAS